MAKVIISNSDVSYSDGGYEVVGTELLVGGLGSSTSERETSQLYHQLPASLDIAV